MDENNNETRYTPLNVRLVELRKKANISASDIALELHVCKSIIDNLEADRTENIPNVFLKGYLRGYAKIVRLPEDELQDYLDNHPALNRPVVMRNFSNKEQRKQHSKRVALISILLLVILLSISGFFIWQEFQRGEDEITSYTPSQYIDSINRNG